MFLILLFIIICLLHGSYWSKTWTHRQQYHKEFTAFTTAVYATTMIRELRRLMHNLVPRVSLHPSTRVSFPSLLAGRRETHGTDALTWQLAIGQAHLHRVLLEAKKASTSKGFHHGWVGCNFPRQSVGQFWRDFFFNGLGREWISKMRCFDSKALYLNKTSLRSWRSF